MDDPIEVGQDALAMEFFDVNKWALESELRARLASKAVDTTVSTETPLNGYSREKMMQIREGENLLNTTYKDFDYSAYKNVRLIENEGIYSTETMKRHGKLMGFTWQKDERKGKEYKAEKDSLAVMKKWFPDKRRKREKVKNSEYWIWHNVNGQQSFAVYFGFFPFYLPHFDAAAFICAARPDCLVPAYLTSQLYQEHLMLREKYESEPYRFEYEKEQRRKLTDVYRRMFRFPLTDENSVVYYEDAEKNAHECTLDVAQLLLRSGFFTSEMKFVVAQRGTEVRGKEWMVFSLSDLIDRNGKSMPFLFANSTHSENMEEIEEISQMKQEMLELAERRARLTEQMQQIELRHSIVRQSIQRLTEKFPMLAYRSAQTHATMGLAAMGLTVDTSEPSHPQFVTKRGVDPFAVLWSTSRELTSRKITGEVEILNRFESLRRRFDRCDKKVLALRTTAMINKQQPASCRLCELKMESASTFIEHITCRKHVSKLTAVCADALDFWFDAIEEVTKKSFEPALSPLSILSFCQRASNPHLNLHQAAATMHRKLQQCDKKALDGEPALRALFNSSVSCDVCIRRVLIDKPANLIAHFATAGHIAAATKNGGQMHAEIIDFWMKALDRAMVADNYPVIRDWTRSRHSEKN